MKIFPKHLRGYDTARGYLHLKGNTLDFGYQKHGAFALVFSFLGFFPLLAVTNFTDSITALMISVLMYVYGWLTEATHYFKPHRVYDPWDAHIMFPFALIGSFFAVVLRLIFFHTLN